MLFYFLFQTHSGIKGLIQDEEGNKIHKATIKVYELINDNWKYIDHDVRSSIEIFFVDIIQNYVCF